MAITQQTILPLKYGSFTIAFHRCEAGESVSVSFGDLQKGKPIVRIHSSCLFGETLHALDCDCARQLSSTLQLIREHGAGVVMYHYAEGRGIGLEKKIQALELQRTLGIDTVEAFKKMGLEPDLRDYAAVLQALDDLGLAKTIQFASQNPRKRAALQEAGYTISSILHPEIEVTEHNRSELLTKKHKLGYDIQSV